MALEPGLYVTATPIGNLKDVTYRAVEALRDADLILCEDTRRTARLCAAYAIATPRAPYHEHNAEAVRPSILRRLVEGAAICLVSDAGTPLISDPGYRLVREARDLGLRVTPLPGPSAFLAALSAAGAPTDRFFFAGFVPAAAGARLKMLAGLADAASTLVFFEAPQRLAASLAAMREALGERRACVAREISKIHEEFREGSLSDLAAHYASESVKGEVVIVVHPPQKGETRAAPDIDALLREALGALSLRDAADAVAQATGEPRKLVYARALKLRGEK